MMFEGHWFATKQTDPVVVCHYLKHYSSEKSGRKGTQFAHGIVGQGETLTLLTTDGSAVFLWQKQAMRDDEQHGICCAIFRNESGVLSSELIREADELAWRKWPGERHFTFVNPSKIRSNNPGACFRFAGWSRCGITKKGLVILEILADEVSA
jgi:hypothetical protein